MSRWSVLDYYYYNFFYICSKGFYIEGTINIICDMGIGMVRHINIIYIYILYYILGRFNILFKLNTLMCLK